MLLDVEIAVVESEGEPADSEDSTREETSQYFSDWEGDELPHDGRDRDRGIPEREELIHPREEDDEHYADEPDPEGIAWHSWVVLGRDSCTNLLIRAVVRILSEYLYSLKLDLRHALVIDTRGGVDRSDLRNVLLVKLGQWLYGIVWIECMPLDYRDGTCILHAGRGTDVCARSRDCGEATGA